MTYHNPFSLAASLRDVCPSVMTASELSSLDIPEVKWVIPKLLPAGLALLAGPPKVGKSYLLLKLAKNITNSGGKIFYFAGEDSHYLLQTRLKQLGMEGCDDLLLHCGREGLFAKPNEFHTTIESVLNAVKLDAIFLDNMELVLPPKPRGCDDYAYYYEQLPRWASLASKHNCAIIMTHHTRKETTEKPLDAILGSQGIVGTCDTVMVMQKAKRDREYDLHVTGKYIPDETYNVVRNGVEFEFDGLAKEALLRMNSAQNQIYGFILENPDCHQKTISNELEMKKGNVCRDIKKLIETEMILGNPVVGYRVKHVPADNFDNSDN